MSRYLYSNLYKTIALIISSSIFIVSLIYFLCSLLVDKTVNITSIILVVSSIVFYCIVIVVVSILDIKAKKKIIFSEDSIIYNGRTYYKNEISFRHFKFYISIFEPSLVFPKLQINVDGLSITCYLSKKDIKRLVKFGYDVMTV